MQNKPLEVVTNVGLTQQLPREPLRGPGFLRDANRSCQLAQPVLLPELH